MREEPKGEFTLKGPDGRDVVMFSERLLGDTLHEISERHDLSIERVRQVIALHATRHLNELEIALLVARKEGNVLALRVPFEQPDQDRELALAYFQWAVAQLKKRDLELRVVPSVDSEGPVLYIDDVTDYGGPNQ